MTKDLITADGIKALKNYKYVGGEYSWLDLRLNGFWAACAEMLPVSMAPNLVTLIGTFHLILIGILALMFDPTLESNSPTWVYICNAWCLWVYQTMDAVDGKQARRTGTSSPLGQLFDHGCDALGSTFIVIGLCSVMGFQTSYLALACLYTVQVPFYFAQWEENHIHVLRSQVGNFGVTEGQYLSMTLNLTRAYFGPTFWKQTLAQAFAMFGLGDYGSMFGVVSTLELRQLAIIIGGFFPFLLAASCVVSVIRSKANLPRAALLLSPTFVQQGFIYYLCNSPPSNQVLAQYAVVGITMSGLLFSHLVNKIIVASVCRMDFPWMHTILLPIPVIVGVMQWNVSFQATKIILAVYSLAIVVNYFDYVFAITEEICRHLDIYCLTIKVKRQ